MKKSKRSEGKALMLLVVVLLLTGCKKVPVASFTVDQEEGISPLTINFTSTSIDAVRYEWMFGDGTTSEEVDPTHTFSYDPAEFMERYAV